MVNPVSVAQDDVVFDENILVKTHVVQLHDQFHLMLTHFELSYHVVNVLASVEFFFLFRHFYLIVFKIFLHDLLR